MKPDVCDLLQEQPADLIICGASASFDLYHYDDSKSFTFLYSLVLYCVFLREPLVVCNVYLIQVVWTGHYVVWICRKECLYSEVVYREPTIKLAMDWLSQQGDCICLSARRGFRLGWIYSVVKVSSVVPSTCGEDHTSGKVLQYISGRSSLIGLKTRDM